MDEIVLLLFLAIIVVLAVAVLVIFMVMSSNEKDSHTASDKPVNQSNKGWKSWIAFLGIALLIALWTIYGALFFLAVVWVMRLNPGSDSSYTVSDVEKNTAKRLYAWLLLSPFITVPIFLYLISSVDSSTSINERVLIALIPLAFHTPLLFGLTSKSAFVFRHTQQSILLMALRASTAALVVNMNPHPDLTLFWWGNGSLWLFGSMIARNQVIRSECWLMKRKGEAPLVATSGVKDLSPQIHIEQSREFILQYKAEEAKKHALAAFRSGDSEVKQQAVQILTNLHEVEKF